MSAYTLEQVEATSADPSIKQSGRREVSGLPLNGAQIAFGAKRAADQASQALFNAQLDNVQALFERSVSLFATLAAALDVTVKYHPATPQSAQRPVVDAAVQQEMDAYLRRIERLRSVMMQVGQKGRERADMASIKECADGLLAIVDGLSRAAHARPDLFSTAPQH